MLQAMKCYASLRCACGAVRARDLTCRLGGEEFVVVMPQTSLADAQAAAERLRAAMASDPFPVGSGSPLVITASVGVAAVEQGAERGEDLLRRADMALYAAKKRGRNRVAADAA
jgi:two-component system cell cycle response regulator